MKLSLQDLRKLVLQEMKQTKKSKSPKKRRTNSEKRERALVENALRLLWEGEEEATQYSSLDPQVMDVTKPSDENLDKAGKQLESYKGGLQKQIDTSLQATVKWLNAILTEKSNPEGEEVCRAVHYLLGHGATQGSGGEQIQIAGDLQAKKPGAKPKCGTLYPTQGEISLFKSIGHPLTDPASFMNCFTGDPHGADKCIVAAGNKVLDGHHRWSSAAVIGGANNIINAVMLKFPKDIDADTEQPLAASQVAIVGSTQYDTLKTGGGADVFVPYATTAGEIEGTGQDDNILGAAGALKLKLMTLYKENKLDLMAQGGEGAWVIKKYKGGITILNDAYLDYAIFGNQGPFAAVEGFPEKFKSALGVQAPSGTQQVVTEGSDDMEDPDAPEASAAATGEDAPAESQGGAITSLAQCTPEQKLKIVEAIADGLQKNWDACPGSKSTDAPARNLMPQFDGGETHSDQVGDRYNGDKDIIDRHMPAGETNYKSSYNESIDLQRWNKLAGLLKD